MKNRVRLPSWFTSPTYVEDAERRRQSIQGWTIAEIEIALVDWKVIFSA